MSECFAFGDARDVFPNFSTASIIGQTFFLVFFFVTLINQSPEIRRRRRGRSGVRRTHSLGEKSPRMKTKKKHN